MSLGVKSVQISGMRNIGYSMKQYTFDKCNYIVGPNGSGKSTILEAIQLALLGYIPGYGKTNQSIFAHASAPMMSINLQLVDNKTGDRIEVIRTFNKKGKSVVSDVSVTPEGIELSNLLSDIELPVFNFSDFIGQSANMLRKWFIEFLPSEEKTVDMKSRIEEYMKESALNYSEVMPDILSQWSIASGSGVDKVVKFNKSLKELLALKKQQLADNQSTVSKLIYYDDFVDSSSVEERSRKISELQMHMTEVCQAHKLRDANAPLEKELNDLTELLSDDASHDEVIRCAQEESAKLQKEYDDLALQIQEISKKRIEISHKIKSYQSVISGQGICPFTKTLCDTIKTLVDDMTVKVESLTSENGKLVSRECELQKKQDSIQAKLMKLKEIMTDRLSQYSLLHSLESNIRPYDESLIVPDLNFFIQDTQSKIDQLSAENAKALANEQYNNMIDTFTKEKYEIELAISVLKEVIELTGPNKLQSEMMSDPLENFTTTFDKYIQKAFGKDVHCQFVGTEKANSFSFGISRGDKYLPYSVLSSGEKCLYLFAFLTCIVENSDCDIKIIMVDDVLDHLDEKNMKRVESFILSNKLCQYIIAGVNPLHDSKITFIQA